MRIAPSVLGIATCVAVGLAVGLATSRPPGSADAGQLGTSIPAHCVEHISWWGADAPGDFRCAGLRVAFHTDGVRRSTHDQWLGQWLYVDDEGQYRVGSCVFNRGTHPSVLGASARVTQSFPNDPTGAELAYLTWRYEDTRDDLTAAALWAVFHYDAQDAAGSTLAGDPEAPLVRDLHLLGEMSGRQDLEDRALALDAEATAFAAPMTLTATIDSSGAVHALVRSGDRPVPGVSVRISSWDPWVSGVPTDADGVARFTIALWPGTNSLILLADTPGAPLVFRGPPASPNARGAQTMLTAGSPTRISTMASIEVAAPTTTTTEPPPTITSTEPPTTSTEPPTTTTSPPPTTSTGPPTTTTEPPTTTTEPPTTTTATTEPPPTITSTEPPTTTTEPPPTTSTTTTTTEPPPTSTTVPPPTTTTVPPPTTTTVPPPTTTTVPPPTTTTVPPPTSTTVPPPTTTTVPPPTTTTEPPPTTTTEPPPTTVPLEIESAAPVASTTTTTSSTTAPPVGTGLPRTGGDPTVPAQLAVGLLVAGIGLLGTLRRRAT